MNTRRYPRTLEEAFGPYCSHTITDPDTEHDYPHAWWIAMYAIAIATMIIIVVTA